MKIHIVPFQFVQNSYFEVVQDSVAMLSMWSWKIFIVRCGSFIQDNAYQFLSKLVKYCRSNDKKIWYVFYAPQCTGVIHAATSDS